MFKKTINYLKVIEQSLFEKEYLAIGVILTTNTIALMIMLFSSLVVTSFIARILLNLSVLIWQKLTPGQETIEICVILTSIVFVVTFFKEVNEFEKKIDESFNRIKKLNDEKDVIISIKNDRITLLEREIAKYDNSFNI
jgi:hypothetical protein